MELDHVVVLFAFRYSIKRKGLALSHIARYIEKHIDELPNSELQECDSELMKEYSDFKDSKMSGIITAKSLHARIQRELYGTELEDEDGLE
jgi:hypothetical protein